MKKYILLLFCTFYVLNAFAQELNATVKINTPQLQTTDPKVFQTLEQSIQSFFNSQKWTEDEYENFERIKVNIQINIKEEIGTSFTADLQIQAVRPVYGSDYETVLLSHQDNDILFPYEQFQPIEYSPNNYVDNLSSILSFYAYYILGLDYDSFQLFGGESYFQIAQDIVNTIPPSEVNKYKGWRSNDGSRNRYWMVENAFNPRSKPMREGMYEYHIKGLDQMHLEVETGKAEMMKGIDKVFKVYSDYPNCMVVQMFNNAKADEIVEVFKVSSQTQKSNVKRIMTKIDAANASRYRKI